MACCRNELLSDSIELQLFLQTVLCFGRNWLNEMDFYPTEEMQLPPASYTFGNTAGLFIVFLLMFAYYRCDGGYAVQCLKGSYSSVDKMSCEPCPVGHYCPTDGLAAPVLCVNSTYQNDTGKVACLQCPAGMSCLSVSEMPSDCPNGTYSGLGVQGCLPCPSGHR